MTGLPFTATTRPDTRWVLNPRQCHLRTFEGRGRGVFAAEAIPPQTVVEISPVLLFSRQEHDDHGKHTLLDHYAFNWKDGRMALALGLGSLFNHAENPNVSYWMDPTRERIVYTSVRAIQPDEELCIFYGHQLWSDPVDGPPCRDSHRNESTGPWGGLADVQVDANNVAHLSSSVSRKMDNIVQEDDLPFTWKKLALAREEEQLDDIELVQAWVVDIPDQTHIGMMLKWLKQSGLDKDTLSHLKRVRRHGALSTLLLDTSSDPPALPPEPPLEPPYQLPVPCHPALTPASLSLKNTFWPTVFTPRRRWEPEPWTRAKVGWTFDAVRRLKIEYTKITQTRELPVVAYVPMPYQDDGRLSRPFLAHDTRTSTTHPLRHAALNVIRQIADHRAEESANWAALETAVKNGVQYLLTGLSLFITHEPCLMCTMALLHSRVKEVFYLVPMPKTGGCGGAACIPSLKGVNHRFSIAVWKGDPGDWLVPLDTGLDI